MSDDTKRREYLDKEIEGNGSKADACAAEMDKVARQPKGSSREKIAQRELQACRDRQSTDSNN